MTCQKIFVSYITWLLKIIVTAFLILGFGHYTINFIEFNKIFGTVHRRPLPEYPNTILITPNYEQNEIAHLFKFTSKNAFFLYQKKMKQMDGDYYEVKTLNTGPVSYDKSQDFPKQIDGTPTWEPDTYNEFNYWLPKSTYYVGFGTWIGVTLFYGTQLVKKAVGFEGDPTAYASVYTNLEGNSHRSWYNHTFIYPVAVRSGNEEREPKRMSMRSSGAGNSCSGMKEVRTRKDNACGNDMNKVSWDIDAYTLPYLLKVNGIPPSKQTFVKIDVESYECELIPSWLDWLKNLSDKPTLFVSFHGKNVRCCSKAQYDKILAVSKLYKGVYHKLKKISPANIFGNTTCTKNEVLVFTDL